MNTSGRSNWTFLTNHSHILLRLVREPRRRLRDVAVDVGITERAVQGIIAELEEAGYIKRTRKGRRNYYRVDRRLRLRHPIEQHRRIGDLVRLIYGMNSQSKKEDPTM